MAINLTGGTGGTLLGLGGQSEFEFLLDATLDSGIFGTGVPFAARAANGATRTNLTIDLPRNALLETLDLKVTATRADLTRAIDVADVRPAVDDPGFAALVIDFGTMRTVNQVLFPAVGTGLFERPVDTAFAWLGTQFAAEADALVLTATESVSRSVDEASYVLLVHPLPEIRTERLLVKLGVAPESVDLDLLAEQLEVALPELPADLAIRLNGGAPIWEQAGAVELGTSAELSADGWTDAGERLVALADALQPFAGDATASGSQSIVVELESRVPGRLALEVAQREELALHRVAFSGDPDLDLDFVQEGATGFDVAVAHPLGDLRTARGLRISLAAQPGPERVLPPVGPEPSGLAELVLGGGRAACVRLDGGAGLAELTGIRLPLVTGAAGAEARLVLWEDSGGVPVTAIPDAVSEPVTIEGEAESWYTFTLEPRPFDPAAPPWAALVVSRGEVAWSLASALEDAPPVRLGPPEGPWRALPAVFGEGKSLGPAVGRVRLVGRASETEPLAPFLLTVADAVVALPVTPVDEGLRLEFSELNEAQGEVSTEPLHMEITSRANGVLNVRDVDVITDV